MNQFRADLHCHTTCSDGSMSPMEILQLAKQVGLSALSITDHDTINAYHNIFPSAKELGIELLTGVELSTSLHNISVHILGYGFQADSEIMQDFCKKHIQRRNSRNQTILELLTKHGMPLTLQDIMPYATTADNTIGRPHIATAMLNKGYVASFQEAFKKFLGEDCPCYSPGVSFSVEETIDVIHQAQGIAVIAHPHLIKNQTALNTLLTMNFDGIECYYGKFYTEQHQRWLKIAKNKGWLVTGGSDFHGTIKPNINLGCSWIDSDAFQAIKQRLITGTAHHGP